LERENGLNRLDDNAHKLKGFLLFMPLISFGPGGQNSYPTPAKIKFGK